MGLVGPGDGTGYWVLGTANRCTGDAESTTFQGQMMGEQVGH